MMMMARTLRATRTCGLNVRLYVSPDSASVSSLGGLWPEHIPRYLQGRGDLTARLGKGLAEAPPGPVLFLGTDAPDISPALIRRAIRQLQTHDAVFGPARDGGFWLFGLHKSARTRCPFANVRWSGPHAMEDVWANLPTRSRIGLLPQLIDIDDASDWQTWKLAKARRRKRLDH